MDDDICMKNCKISYRFEFVHQCSPATLLSLLRLTLSDSQGNPAITVYDYILRLKCSRSLLAFSVRQFSHVPVFYYNAQHKGAIMPPDLLFLTGAVRGLELTESRGSHITLTLSFCYIWRITLDV